MCFLIVLLASGISGSRQSATPILRSLGLRQAVSKGAASPRQLRLHLLNQRPRHLRPNLPARSLLQRFRSGRDGRPACSPPPSVWLSQGRRRMWCGWDRTPPRASSLPSSSHIRRAFTSVRCSGALPATHVIPITSSSGDASARRIAIASSWPGSVSIIIFFCSTSAT